MVEDKTKQRRVWTNLVLVAAAGEAFRAEEGREAFVPLPHVGRHDRRAQLGRARADLLVERDRRRAPRRQRAGRRCLRSA